MTPLPRLMAASLSFILATAVTQGAIITYEFNGDLNTLEDPARHFGGVDVFSGSFSFDTASPDLNPEPDVGEYAGTSLTMQFGPTEVSVPSVMVQVLNDEPVPGEPWNIWDRIVISGTGQTPSGIEIQYFGLGMVEESAEWIHDDGLPLTLDWGLMQDLDDNAEISVGVHFPDGASAYATGVITQLIPEPTSLGLLMIAVVVCARPTR